MCVSVCVCVCVCVCMCLCVHSWHRNGAKSAPLSIPFSSFSFFYPFLKGVARNPRSVCRRQRESPCTSRCLRLVTGAGHSLFSFSFFDPLSTFPPTCSVSHRFTLPSPRHTRSHYQSSPAFLLCSLSPDLEPKTINLKP